MMDEVEKSDLSEVAGKPANACGRTRAGVGGAKGGDQGEHEQVRHALDAEPGKCEHAGEDVIVVGIGTHRGGEQFRGDDLGQALVARQEEAR